MTGNREEKEDLNNEDTEINRGVELVLRNKKGGKRKPKTFEVNFCSKMDRNSRDQNNIW